jgi:hypothetical protein
MKINLKLDGKVEAVECDVLDNNYHRAFVSGGFDVRVRLLADGGGYRKGALLLARDSDLVRDIDSSAVNFFIAHAGYCTPPGREACARNLAEAEVNAKAAGFRFVWADDPDGCSGCDCCPKEKRAGIQVEYCQCIDENGSVLASLSGICGADNNYRRVIEAELVSEAGA